MATVTGLTAERMFEMEQATVIDGEVRTDNLILITRGGTEIDAGSVRGPVGPQGPPLPAGVILSTVRSTPDVGFLFLDGATITGAQTANPALWAAVPNEWKTGSNIILPDARGRMLIGDDLTLTLGALVGSNSLTLTSAHLPKHVHALDHDHPQVSATMSETAHVHSQPGHTHTVYQDSSGNAVQYVTVAAGGNYNALVLNGSGGYALPMWAAWAGINTNGATTGISATVNLPNFVGNTSDGGFANTPLIIPTPPALVVNWQIKT